METLMTVLKRFQWPIYKLKKTVNQTKGAHQKQHGKRFSTIDSCGSKHLKFLFCYII